MTAATIELKKQGIEKGKQESPMIKIIGFGEMRDSQDQIKVDTISILGELDFSSLQKKNFRLHSEKECNEIIFEKQTKTSLIKEQRLPIFKIDKILSKIYWEDQKIWEGSFFEELEDKKIQIVGVITDDHGEKCFLTFLISDLHKKRIIICSEQNMKDYLFEDNYLFLTKSFNAINGTFSRFYGEN
jgi:hypothetical protein